jgi:superfamily II DNA or RNA helicase/HKD family nuclease
MKKDTGFYEEIKRKTKEYPEKAETYILAPRKYASTLTQYIAERIGHTLKRLEDTDRYMEMIELVYQIERQLQTSQHDEFATPLSIIHYNSESSLLPRLSGDSFLREPFLITNQKQLGRNFFKELKFELMTADRADFIVSFVRWSGLQLLLRAFDEMIQAGKKIRILTSTYLNITEPKALRRLMELENVEVKCFLSGALSFHPKAYLFYRSSGQHTAIIGSSNMTRSAIESGHEWNVKLPDMFHLPIYKAANELFKKMWEDKQAVSLSTEWLDTYEQQYQQSRQRVKNVSKMERPFLFLQEKVADPIGTYNTQQEEEQKIAPNEMQRQALSALIQTRENGRNKGVIIAATGTGKTYLSAFDVKQFGAKTVLFLAHRDELLENARKTFINVFGEEHKMGKLTGTIKEVDCPFLFSTVQTLNREDTLSSFSPEQFEYIIVDEFHHAEAATYRKILSYFRPKFLLGLTATPERMDGRDVLALCDYNVVFEIRLHQALEKDLLAPFHYFGLSDNTVDYEQIPIQSGKLQEQALVRALKTHERVEYIIEMIEKYGFCGEYRKALAFCASVEHARYMTEAFERKGYHAACLTGQDSPDHRRHIIERVEDDADPLEFIFTVDIFNEGIDIPSLNLILFLRPTESPTIFIQQLGRGLRKAPGKEYVTILDFIGNYQKSFIVPLALSGQTNHRAFDREALRVAIESEFQDLPAGCFVELEEISRRRILEKISSIRMDATQMLKDLYQAFAREVGEAPEIMDFLYSAQAPSFYYFVRKYGSWVETKKKMKDSNTWDEKLLASPLELQIVQRLEQALPLKWPYEFAVLELAMQKKAVSIGEVIDFLNYRFSLCLHPKQHEAHIVSAMQRLSSPYKKQSWSFGRMQEKQFFADELIRSTWNADWICDYLQQRLQYGFIEFQRVYKPTDFFQSENHLLLYQNYTRNELIYLFNAGVKEGSWREGVSRVGSHYLLFVTLNKGDNVEEHLNYHDYFIDHQHFHWQSQNNTAHHSSRGQEYIHHAQKGIHIHLFVRKVESMHGATLPFMYIGEVDYIKSHGDNPMNIVWKLHHPLPETIFMDFVR